ncbi:MAG: class I SAM-dependent methyltransferase [Actinomycetota bacterium]|nr:class I SAM-dependent methyltransferase [Actinomycetota bacterium]
MELDLREGDAEALPVGDAAFDRVLSGFAMIFAPRHLVVAAEAARVCRPGGLVAFTAWTPDSMPSRLFEALSRYLPEPPSYVSPSSLWGDPGHVRRLFAEHDVNFEFDVMTLPWEFPDVDAFERFTFTYSGPLIAAQQVLEQAGRWQDARADMRAVFEEVNRSTDGSFRADLEYLIAVGRRNG